MSGKKARAARQAVPAQTVVGKRYAKPGPKVRGMKKYQPTTTSRYRRGVWVLVAIPVIVAALYAVTALAKGGGGNSMASGHASHGSSAYPYSIGSPGPGQPAPALSLPATSGGTFDLASYKGKSQVLLYFQEGLTCEPCWTQLQAIQKELPKFHALGIGPIVSITTDPLNLLQQKVSDEGITIPVLSDAGAKVSGSGAYGTNHYQMMMMGDRDGHSFILVGKDGRIRWRADYGGAPKYTMYVPDSQLLADLRQGMKAHA